MSDQLPQTKRPLLEHLHQGRGASCIDEAHCHREVISPQLLQVNSGLLAMHPNIRDTPPQRHQLLTQLKRRWNPHRLNYYIAAHPIRRLLHGGDRLGGTAAEVCAHGFCGPEARRVVVDHNDLGGRVEFGRQEGAEADGAGADDGDGFARGDRASEDADFVAGGNWGDKTVSCGVGDEGGGGRP